MALTPGNLVVPVVLWGKQPPPHRISNICLLGQQFDTMISGSADGQLCVWNVDKDFNLHPRYMLFGHTASIVALSCAGVGNEAGRFVSSSANGELFLWNSQDGRLLEMSKSQQAHTSIKLHILHSPSDVGDMFLFCCGHYAEIQALDPRSLQPMFSLASRVEPDWIACFCILRPHRKPIDVVIGLSVCNVVKIWTLDTKREFRSPDPLYEDESKQLREATAVQITCCEDNQRCMLIVSEEAWQIFDASDFSLLCTVDVPPGEQWLGGCFTAVDKVAMYCSDGVIYLYQLPRSKIRGNIANVVMSAQPPSYAPISDPLIYCVLKANDDVENASSAPAYQSVIMPAYGERKSLPVIFQGTRSGDISVWRVPAVSDKAIASLQQEKFDAYPHTLPMKTQGLRHSWRHLAEPPVGIVDILESAITAAEGEITSTLYLPGQGRLVLGRRDGSIFMTSATHSLMRNTLDIKNKPNDWPVFRTLHGHQASVTCLLYPAEEHPRYDVSHLVSGGADFCVCLWDLHAGTMLHRFCVQAGEIMRLIIPPETCNNRVLFTVCSVASDHSIALLSLKDHKCMLLASKHLFPVRQLRWRPLDDFLVVQCEDGTVYVWQMETGHLDRIITGMLAEEVLVACQEQVGAGEGEEESVLANPAVQFFRAIKHKNISAMKKVAEQVSGGSVHDSHAKIDNVTSPFPPLMIQGIRPHKDDAEAHILLFNIEAMILELLREEYAVEFASLSAAADASSVTSGIGDASPRISGLLSKVKDKAENVGHKLHSMGISPLLPKRLDTTPLDKDAKKTLSLSRDSNLNMEIAQLLLSYLHAWSMDENLDLVCSGKLGLLKPSKPLCFGLMSRQGHLSLMLPSFAEKPRAVAAAMGSSPQVTIKSPADAVKANFDIHWIVSPSLTTQHLLTVISMANTLMATTSGSFLPEQGKKRKLIRRLSTQSGATPQTPAASEAVETAHQEASQIKQGWSLLAALHCVLLPELVGPVFQPPRIELLARRWQDRCHELRDASQALLLRELARLGPAGRKTLVDRWSPFLPTQLDASLSIFASQMVSGGTGSSTTTSVTSPVTGPPSSDGNGHGNSSNGHSSAEWSGSAERVDSSTNAWSIQEVRRNQATAVVLLGVIGSQYAQEIIPSGSASLTTPCVDHSLARAISQSLLELLLHPATPLLPAFTPLRRAAIDLLGRGFPVWQPYLEMPKLLLGLLELCIGSEKLLPTGPYHFPLSPQADTCLTARHALTLIASSRPSAFITALCREVSRYNQTLQHQAVQHSVPSPLPKTKVEILRIIESLADKQYMDIVDMMLPVGDILVFCLDISLLKQKTLSEVFPVMSRFYMVSYCMNTRRIAFGGKNGSITIHELRAGKYQTVQAHGKPVTASAFSEDGKHLATYSAEEGKLNFWQTSQSFLGMGQSQVKCIRQMQAPYSFPVSTPGGTPTPFKARLVWISPKAVTLMLPNGKEHRIAMS